jgi:hypothetical protein
MYYQHDFIVIACVVYGSYWLFKYKGCINFYWWNEYLILQHMILLNIISTRLTKFKAFVKESILNLEDITHII